MVDRLLPNILSPGYWRRTWQELQLVWRLLRDPRVPAYQKVLPGLVLVYLLSPFDFIPGFLPIIGQMDDLALLLLALKLFTRIAPEEIALEYKQALELDRVQV